MTRPSVVALSGGIGGARLALGLQRVLLAGDLAVVANTADDFEHLGLCISPDVDTLMYTLAGLENPETGWGRRDESWAFMDAVAALGGETWFRLGDADLATHVERTRRVRAGEGLASITAEFCRRLGVPSQILPMTDDPIRTRLRTGEGWLDFQDYFVRQRCQPVIAEIEFADAASTRPNPALLSLLAAPGLRAVVICPSNPLVSVEPILAVPGLRAAIAATHAPVVAVSPLIGGKAVKGPTAKMMHELGLDVDAASVGRRYADLLDAYVVDEVDAATTVPGVPIIVARTLMRSLDDRDHLARVVLAAAEGGKRSRG